MKQILNWTAGAFFRSIGRFLFFVLIGGLFAILIAKSDIKLPNWLMPLYVKADTLDYTLKQYRIQYYSLSEGTTAWNSWTNFQTGTSFSGGYGVKTIAVRFGSSSSNKFQSGTSYRVVVETGFSPSDVINRTYLYVDSFTCNGSSGTSSWSNDSSLVTNCVFVGASRVSGTNHVKYIFDIEPTAVIQGIQFNINFGGTEEVNSVNVYNKSSIVYGPDISSVIEDQTIIIQNEFNELSETIIQNNEELINAITENNTFCEAILVNNQTKGLIHGSLGSSCNFTSSSTQWVSPFYKLSSSSTINGLRTGGYYCFYDESKTVVGSRSSSSVSSISIPNGAVYVRFAIPNNTNNFFNIYTCKSNTESINDSITDLKDTITDTDIDSDTSSLDSFFHDFNLSIEGPISQIVLLPINLLNTLLVDYNSSSYHADLCTTFRGQNICLPSGDILWKRTGCHDNAPFGCGDLSALKDFFQLVAGGSIVYYLLRRLVDAVEKGLDPSSTRVDLMKL